MIGISYHAGGMRDLPLEQVVQILSDVGYDAIEMMCGPEAHIRSDEVSETGLRAVKQLCDDHGLAVAVINPFAGPGLYQLALMDEQRAIDHYALLQDVALSLGAAGVNFLTGYGGERGDAFAWRLLVKVLKPICRRAERLGLTMNIHNHEATTIDSPNKVRLLMRHVDSPALKLLNDITNFHHLGADIRDTTLALADVTSHCHVKGVEGMYPYSTFLIPGEQRDELDFAAFAGALGEAGYHHYVSVETFPHMRLEKARIAFDMMARVLGELGLRA